MPVVSEEDLKALLAAGDITSITFDTSVFDRFQKNLDAPVFRTIAGLKHIPFRFVMPSTVLREMEAHLRDEMKDAVTATKKALGDALRRFETKAPTRDEILHLVTGGATPEGAADVRIRDFIADSQCDELDDPSLVPTAIIFDAYFDRSPPFSSGKKSEFPDALALNALESDAAERDGGTLVVTTDDDWKEYCDNSLRLYHIPELPRALGLISDTPLGVRKAVFDWMAWGAAGQTEVGNEVGRLVEGMDVDVSGYASSGAVEFEPYETELRSVEWPGPDEIDIIESEDDGDGNFSAVVSLPLILSIRVSIDLSFSVWDSIDKESVGMGGRSETVDIDTQFIATVTLKIFDVGGAEEEIVLEATELDTRSLDVELGDIDVFEPEDYEQ